MDPEDLQRLHDVGTETEIAAGQVFIEHGQYGAGLYVILEGTVTVEAAEGTRELGPGSVLGERALLSPTGRRTARVRATSDVRALAVGRAEFDRLCTSDPPFARRLADRGA